MILFNKYFTKYLTKESNWYIIENTQIKQKETMHKFTHEYRDPFSAEGQITNSVSIQIHQDASLVELLSSFKNYVMAVGYYIDPAADIMLVEQDEVVIKKKDINEAS